MSKSYSTVPGKANKQPIPFTISIPDKDLEELKVLLRLSKLAAPTYESLQEDGQFGVTHKWMSEAKTYWEEEYDWRKFEKRINGFPNFTTNVTVDETEHKIHFIGLFSDNPDAIPIVLLHGWPELPYHIIVPSLPGYAFSSSPPLDRDFTTVDVAAVVHQLMLGLGFGSVYIAQGGDIGSIICKILADSYEECKAIHLNFHVFSKPISQWPKSSLTPLELSHLKRGEEFITKGSAYSFEHATRPSTIGFALASNPISLLAWIGEKFLTWTDDDPSLDEILDNVTLYWLTETFPTSIYPYRGMFLPQPQPGSGNIKKPTGFSSFPKEILPAPKGWLEEETNLVLFREHEKGGHFAALEKPVELLKDVEDFVKLAWTK